MPSALTIAPEIGYTYSPDDPVVILRYGGTLAEQRAILGAKEYRTYAWTVKRTDAERKVLDAFFRVARGQATAFYIRDPKDASRVGVSLGTSVSGQTSFPLPSSGDNSRDYPISGATVTVYDDGVATAATVTVHTDGQSIGLSAAPTSGSVMTADYIAYRLVRVEGRPSWTLLAPNWWECQLDLREVPA